MLRLTKPNGTELTGWRVASVFLMRSHTPVTNRLAASATGRRNLRGWTLALLLFLGTGAAEHELVETWIDLDRGPVQFRKLVVVGISADREMRNRFEDKFVAHGDILQRSKKPVAVSGDADVSNLARQSGALDLTDATIQDQIIGADEDGHLDPEPWDPQKGDGRVHFGQEALLKLLDASNGPEGRIDRI